ncbi:MAG TPA: sugar phosphate isomerase/epimerase [Lacipirellulaceae bacterium]|jgi:sugar phosphate isomerase/epimerase|nr:sugar phosphate isomerase/epimerase [Lacipirellulaceae bacterium]
MTLLSMNEITTFRWSFEEDVENYLEAGYNAIGVWRHKLSDGDENHAIDLLAASGLEVSHLSWAGGFTGSDGRSLSESVDDAQDALRLAAGIMAKCLTIYSGGRNNHTFRHAGRLLRIALEKILPLAEDMEMPLAIEPMHAVCAADWTFLTDLESVLSLLNEFNSPFLKIAYDAYHFPIYGRHRDVLGRLAPHIGIVHLSDRRHKPSVEQERCPLGFGRLPLGDIICTLQDAGYAGAYDIKLVGSEVETFDYWTLLQHSQLAFNELAPAPAQRSFA